MASNLTEIDLSWIDPYFTLNLKSKSILASYIVIVLLIGTLLNVGIVSFERYGADPQKRGLTNQVNKIPSS